VLVLGHDGVPTGLSVDGENQGAREFGVGRPELGWWWRGRIGVQQCCRTASGRIP